MMSDLEDLSTRAFWTFTEGRMAAPLMGFMPILNEL